MLLPCFKNLSIKILHCRHCMKFEGITWSLKVEFFLLCVHTRWKSVKTFHCRHCMNLFFGTSRVKLYSGWDGLEYLYLAVYLLWKAVGDERFRVDSRKNCKTRLNFLANSVESCFWVSRSWNGSRFRVITCLCVLVSLRAGIPVWNSNLAVDAKATGIVGGKLPKKITNTVTTKVMV